jgi:hypothetical protein
MNEEDARVRRLIQWNRFWVTLIMLGFLAWFANWQIRGFFADFEKLRVSWQSDGSLNIFSGSDGPFVITHLVVANAIAPLPRRLVLDGSGDVGLSKAEFDKLTWFGRRSGEPVAPPKKESGVQIVVLYYKSGEAELAK